MAALIFTASASAETIQTIAQVEKMALLNNLDYKLAVLDVMKAEHALEGSLKLDGSSIGLTGSREEQENNGEYGWQASANLPVFEQISLGAAVDHNLKKTLSMNFTPLSHSGNAEQSMLAYGQKLAAAEYAANEVADAAVESYLEWAVAMADLENRKESAEVKRTLYADEKVRFDKGESDLDEVRDAFTSWSESRTAVNDASSRLQRAEADLYLDLNINPAEFHIEKPAEEDLLILIASLEETLAAGNFSIGESYPVSNAEAASENLKLQLKNIWLFEPQLTISGGLSFPPGSSTPELSAAISLGFSLDDWNSDERKEFETELEISRQQAAQILNTEELKLQQAKTSVESRAINYEVAETGLDQAKELLDEANFLFERGEYSAAELSEARLLYEQSRNSLFSAAADHYMALRELAAYIR